MPKPNIRTRTRASIEIVEDAAPPARALSNFANNNLAIAYVRVGEIRLPERHLRKHSQRQLHQIAESIRRFGFNSPVIVDENNCVVAGVGRVLAAPAAGIDRIPVVQLSHLTPAELRAYRIAENRLAEKSTWDSALLALELGELSALELDFDLELTGFETAEIDNMLETLGDDTPDADDQVEQVSEGPAISQRGDLWQLGEHRLLCGDARERGDYEVLMRGGDRAQMVFTDPPYNVRIDGNVCGLGSISHAEFAMASGEMTTEEFTEFLSAAFANMVAVSEDGAIHFACIDWRHLGEMVAAGQRHYTELKNVVVWNKDNAGLGTFYRSKHELVFVWKVGTAQHVNTFGLGGSGRYRTNVWDYAGISSIGRQRSEQLAMHPTVKPVALVADAIKDCSRRGDIILDPFGGSGTTIIAAGRTGRLARCIEFEPKYVDVSIRRWERVTGGTATLAGNGLDFHAVAQLRA